MTDAVQPFHIQIPDNDLTDLRERVTRTRWPEAEPVDDWSQGVPLDYLTDLCRYRSSTYDWRATEKRLNRFPQIRTTIDRLDIHALHVRSPHPHATPLILTHGWPGSFLEFEATIGAAQRPDGPRRPYGRCGTPRPAFSARLWIQWPTC